MPASKKTQEFIEKELPYKILMKMYENSRASLRQLGADLHISYHVVHSLLNQLQDRYQLAYTLEIGETELGFTEGKIITVKFKTRPSVDFLKEKLKKDIFVQDAFLAEGDFDILLYVVGLNPKDFQAWQWNLRTSLSEYKPNTRFANVNSKSIGFLPLRSELLNEATTLSNTERQILALLNDDSRMKIQDIAKKTKTSWNKVIYIMKKLKERKIITKFTTLTQNPDKRLFSAYGVYLTPTSAHLDLANAFAKELLNEDFKEIVSDYSLDANTSGDYDVFYICSFSGGEVLSKRGPDRLQTLWQTEEPKIEKAILTDVLVGKWPFHLEEYAFAKKIISTSS